MTKETVSPDQVWDILSADMPPRDYLYSEPGSAWWRAKQELSFMRYAGAFDIVDKTYWYSSFLYLLAACKWAAVEPWRIRAACQLVLGQPCWPEPGSLTLCEPQSEAGALSMSQTGSLTVIR